MFQKSKLTRSGFLSLIDPSLVPPGGLAQGLVANADGDNGEEGEDQRRRAADVPALEYDAEVLRVPGKEHLYCFSFRKRRPSPKCD